MASKRALILAAISTGWAIVAYQGWNNPTVQAWLRSCGSCTVPTISWDRTKEPRIGFKVQLPEADTFGRSIACEETFASVLLVVAGSCTDCSVTGFRPEALPNADKFSRIVIVFSTLPRDWSKSVASLPKRYRLVSDPHRTIGTGLNASWVPRFYVLDSDFRLVDAQTPGMPPQTLRPVQQGDRR